MIVDHALIPSGDDWYWVCVCSGALVVGLLLLSVVSLSTFPLSEVIDWLLLLVPSWEDSASVNGS